MELQLKALIKDILDTLNGSMILSTVDLATGYWQLNVYPGSIEKIWKGNLILNFDLRLCDNL